ncbi:MAG: hypothetical protein ACR2JJ_10700 [Sphingomicrobium sp.]
MIRSIASLTHVVNLKSALVAALAVLSTWVSLRLGITADFPLTLVATAIVFPLVFSISTAYQRREKALEDYGKLKALGRSLYLASRDWLPRQDSRRDGELKAALYELLSASRDMFTSPLTDMARYEARIHVAFGRLSLFVRDMRGADLSATECSRLNQYVSQMMTAFENIKHIYEYRTPRTLRAFSEFFILLLSVLYGPYFAYQAIEFSPDLFFVMPALFALILVGLSNIQDHLENPFDQIGQDDVAIDPDHFLATLESNRVATATPAR